MNQTKKNMIIWVSCLIISYIIKFIFDVQFINIYILHIAIHHLSFNTIISCYKENMVNHNWGNYTNEYKTNEMYKILCMYRNISSFSVLILTIGHIIFN